MLTPPPNIGGTRSEQEALQLLLTRLIEGLEPVKILLFGSRARGDARPDSDFDLLVVLPDDTPDDQADYDAVYAPVLGSGIGCDIVPCRLSEYQSVMGDASNPWRESWSRARSLHERR
ncbi:MAG: nucleotidyltransferase domain-containing protein [Alphaproteobacteria bacterium]|nr:nucleotidyltransferase domain-containing protein [Alphaproteobacteria bacterium]MCB9792225.1 nucleotidyltransferase domain-containing protein [Alphaproteobacteria bacterium]